MSNVAVISASIYQLLLDFSELSDFTFGPVSPGIPRPPSIPGRPYETHNLVWKASLCGASGSFLARFSHKTQTFQSGNLQYSGNSHHFSWFSIQSQSTWQPWWSLLETVREQDKWIKGVKSGTKVNSTWCAVVLQEGHCLPCLPSARWDLEHPDWYKQEFNKSRQKVQQLNLSLKFSAKLAKHTSDQRTNHSDFTIWTEYNDDEGMSWIHAQPKRTWSWGKKL